MRIVTKQIEVYKFDELSENIKRKMIEKEKQDIFQDFIDFTLYDLMAKKAQELVKKYFKNNNVKINNILYSLSWCQGDGAMFEFELYYYNKLVKIKNNGWYTHAKSFYIDTWELTDKQEEQLNNKVLKMFEEFEAYGWDCVDFTVTDKEAAENLQQNEYLFDGTIYY